MDDFYGKDDGFSKNDFITNVKHEIIANWHAHIIVDILGEGLTIVRPQDSHELRYFNTMITQPFYHAKGGLQQLQELEERMVTTFSIQECQKNLYHTTVQGLIEARSQAGEENDGTDTNS